MSENKPIRRRRRVSVEESVNPVSSVAEELSEGAPLVKSEPTIHHSQPENNTQISRQTEPCLYSPRSYSKKKRNRWLMPLLTSLVIIFLLTCIALLLSAVILVNNGWFDSYSELTSGIVSTPTPTLAPTPTPTPSPIPTPTPTAIIEYIYLTPAPTTPPTPPPIPTSIPTPVIEYVYLTPEPTVIPTPTLIPTPTPTPSIKYVYLTPSPTPKKALTDKDLIGDWVHTNSDTTIIITLNKNKTARYILLAPNLMLPVGSNEVMVNGKGLASWSYSNGKLTLELQKFTYPSLKLGSTYITLTMEEQTYCFAVNGNTMTQTSPQSSYDVVFTKTEE